MIHFLFNYLPKKFPSFQELNVVHNYLISNIDTVQVRIRKSGQGGNIYFIIIFLFIFQIN